MKRNGRILSALPFGAAFALSAKANAQGERSNRIDPHPVRQQVGIVSRVIDRSAWVAFARPVKTGAKIEISGSSDGADILFVGTADWTSSSAPYEAYVTNIHAISTKHDRNEFDDDLALGALKHQVDYGTQPETIGEGVFLAAGYFVRAALDETTRPSEDSPEPVRANIASLRARKTRMATAIADAAEKALGLDPLIAPERQIPEFAVNYSALQENLRGLRRLSISDPITDKLLNRLLSLAFNSGQVGASVPNNFFRPPSAVSPTSGGTSSDTTSR